MGYSIVAIAMILFLNTSQRFFALKPMKHLLWITCLLLLGAYSLQAQESEQSTTSGTGIDSVYARQVVVDNQPRDLYYGIRFGASLSSLGGDADSTSNKVGLLFGAFVGKDLATNLSVLAGLQYMKMGATIESDIPQIGLTDPPSGTTLNTSYSYLALPVQVRYFPYEKYGIFVEGGLQFSILLRAELIGLGGSYEDSDGYVNIKDQLTSLDVAPRLGIGYEWNKGLEFSLNYQLGMLNTLADSDLTVNNTGWQFILGYRF